MGALFVLISAIGFGSMALFANMAYADGVDTFSLLTLRFVIAASLLGALAVVRGARFPRGRALRSYAGMGVVYTAMAWGYFGALHHAPSATVALVLYVYPILVALAAFALRLDRFGWPEAGTLVLSSLGLYLVLGGSTQGSGTGLLLAFVAAVCYSGYILIGSRKHMEGDAVACSTVVLSTAAVCCFALSFMQGGQHWPNSPASWAATVGVAVFGTAVAIAAFVAGLKRIGPTQAAVLSTLEPVVTVILGVVFLREQLTVSAAACGCLILAAAIVLTLGRNRRLAKHAPAAGQPRNDA